MSKAPTRHARLIIIGSGPAGYTAAIYAARAMLEPILIAGFEPGGQLMITTDVENYPGFAEPIQGPWLMEQMRLQAEHVGAQSSSDHIVKVELARPPVPAARRQRHALYLRRADHRHRRQGQMAGHPVRGNQVQGLWRLGLRHLRRLLLSRQAGRRRRRRQYRGRGGALSSHLATQGHGRAPPRSFRAERILQERLFKQPNSKSIWDSAVDEICGDGEPLGVTRAAEERQDGRAAGGRRPTASSSPSAISRLPSCSLASSTSSRTAISRRRPFSTATNIPGVFAAGDVTDDIYRQAVTAAGLGCMAALEAERWLARKAHRAGGRMSGYE